MFYKRSQVFLDVTDTKGISFGDMDFDKPKVYSDTPSPMVLSD